MTGSLGQVSKLSEFSETGTYHSLMDVYHDTDRNRGHRIYRRSDIDNYLNDRKALLNTFGCTIKYLTQCDPGIFQTKQAALSETVVRAHAKVAVPSTSASTATTCMSSITPSFSTSSSASSSPYVTLGTRRSGAQHDMYIDDGVSYHTCFVLTCVLLLCAG